MYLENYKPYKYININYFILIVVLNEKNPTFWLNGLTENNDSCLCPRKL